MKAVILAGGLGTRITEESHLKPKPMIEIGHRPILWHIMKLYSHHGIREFIICCGYKGHLIKEYFVNYYLYNSDLTVNLKNNSHEVHHRNVEPWRITLVDTGDETPTGTRLKRVLKYLDQEEPFCVTYGDGLTNLDITQEIKFHLNHQKVATLAAVRPPGKYGILESQNGKVTSFKEKIEGDGNRINGGFFIFSPKVFEFIKDERCSLEIDVLPRLSEVGQLMSFNHDGFWQCMDTMRDKIILEDMWTSGTAPWFVWSGAL